MPTAGVRRGSVWLRSLSGFMSAVESLESPEALCKLVVAGSVPIRSIRERPAQAGFFFASVDDHRPLGAFMSAKCQRTSHRGCDLRVMRPIRFGTRPRAPHS